jgi:hypothetical protein
MTATKTSRLRLLKWWLRNGPKKLQAAQLRRQAPAYPNDITPHMAALRLLMGNNLLDKTVLAFIRSYPLARRLDAFRSLSRILTAPQRKK